MVNKGVEAQFQPSIQDISESTWSDLAPEQPFTNYKFLNILEKTGVVGEKTAWQPFHLNLREDEESFAVMPCYIKFDSWGEFIFDFAWAEAYHRHGLNYYPKLLSAVPYSPVPGNRCLSKDLQRSMPICLDLYKGLCREKGFSSAHILYMSKQEADIAKKKEWLIRPGFQYHWFNKGYASFEEFLETFRQKTRKNLRRERRFLAEEGIRFKWYEGSDIDAEILDHFYDFYKSTFEWKSGFVPFPREVFECWVRELGANLVFIGAKQGGKLVAGSINFRDSQALYGRYWGCKQNIKFLHFETCYHQGIEYCIEHGLTRMEPGAQGEFKIKRGFEPIPIFSAHWIDHPQFRDAIGSYVKEEHRHSTEIETILNQHLPFKRNPNSKEENL